MALHGQVQVNGHVLGWWQARRLTPLRADAAAAAQVHQYVWEVQDAESLRTWSGTLRHRYGSGPAVLASKVLAAAHEAGAQIGDLGGEQP